MSTLSGFPDDSPIAWGAEDLARAYASLVAPWREDAAAVVPTPLRIIVTGGRRYDDAQRISEVFDLLAEGHHPITICHGACRGADTLAQTEARRRGWETIAYKADWSRGGRAGPERNQRMVNDGADKVIAFPGNIGTLDCMRKAHAAHIPVYAVDAHHQRGITRWPSERSTSSTSLS